MNLMEIEEKRVCGRWRETKEEKVKESEEGG